MTHNIHPYDEYPDIFYYIIDKNPAGSSSSRKTNVLLYNLNKISCYLFDSYIQYKSFVFTCDLNSKYYERLISNESNVIVSVVIIKLMIVHLHSSN